MRVCALIVVTLLLLMVLSVSACQTQGGTENQTPTPQMVGEWDEGGLIVSAAATEIGGYPYVYLMTAESGKALATLHVLDVSDPAAPMEVASLQTPIDVMRDVMVPFGGMNVSGNRLYASLIGPDETSFWVLDISDPTAPLEIARAETEYAWLGPVMESNFVVTRTGLVSRFAVIDVSDPEHPERLADFELERLERPGQLVTRTVSTALTGFRFFVVKEDGVTAFDLSTPSDPRQVSFYANDAWEGPADAEGAEEAGTTVLYGITASDLIFEEATPPGSFLDIAVSGDHAFIAGSDLGLVVLDVSDLSDMREVGRHALPTRARRVVVNGHYAYVLGFSVPEDEDRPSSSEMFHPLYVVDVSQPDNPRLAATVEGITGLPPSQSIAVAGDSVIVTNNRTLHVIDLYAEK